MRRWLLVFLLAACTASTGIMTTSASTVATPSAGPTTTVDANPVTTDTRTVSPSAPPAIISIDEYPVPAGSHPHDVAPGRDGTIWYTGQRNGMLGRLDPASGDIDEIPLGPGSAPHGVIVGPDGAPWITDSGLNAIVRVDPTTSAVDVFTLPGNDANLNTAVFDLDGLLWFTGQNGVYGSFDPASEEISVFEAPGGAGPYGITVTPDNQVYYASLAGSHITHIEPETRTAEPIEPPTPEQGSRRVWSDSQGTIWVSEWNVGQVGAYDPAAGTWQEWALPGQSPQAYAVYVDETDRVWLTDFGDGGVIVRFDPATETFESFPLPTAGGDVRQLLGRPGEIWGAESSADALVVVRYES